MVLCQCVLCCCSRELQTRSFTVSWKLVSHGSGGWERQDPGLLPGLCAPSYSGRRAKRGQESGRRGTVIPVIMDLLLR